MITKAIDNSFIRTKEKGWDCAYWAFDIHDTIIKPNWKFGEIPTEFYPRAVEAMQLISKLKGIKRILYTCSHPDEIVQYLELFKKNNIHFDYVNENPEVINKKYGFYDHKPYFNVLFEDKAGFDPYTDWPRVIELVKKWTS